MVIIVPVVSIVIILIVVVIIVPIVSIVIILIVMVIIVPVVRIMAPVIIMFVIRFQNFTCYCIDLILIFNTIFGKFQLIDTIIKFIFSFGKAGIVKMQLCKYEILCCLGVDISIFTNIITIQRHCLRGNATFFNCTAYFTGDFLEKIIIWII